MPLRDRQILAERDAGNLVIEPFERRNLGSDTYDVHLGSFYYREQLTIGCTVYDIYNAASVAAVWGEAQRARENRIWIEPSETILAHTAECNCLGN